MYKNWPKRQADDKTNKYNKQTAESSNIIVEKVIGFNAVMEVAAANASWFDKFSSLNGDLQINMQKKCYT